MLYVDSFHHTQPSPMTVEVSWDSTPWDTASSICSALEAAATCTGARAHATSDTQLGALFAALKKIPSDWESKLATASQQGALLSWLRQAMQYCHHVGDSCKQVQWERKKVQLVEVRAKLAEWAGGAKNGESWKDRIPETVGPKTWSLLEQAHREHLSQLDTMEWVREREHSKRPSQLTRGLVESRTVRWTLRLSRWPRTQWTSLLSP